MITLKFDYPYIENDDLWKNETHVIRAFVRTFSNYRFFKICNITPFLVAFYELVVTTQRFVILDY